MKQPMKLPTLDLHGYKTADIADAVDKFLTRNSSKPRIRIMTGKGTGAVQKAVTDYLKLGGFPWEYEKADNGQNKNQRNEGVIVVILD